jgi:hypothetical protein
VSASLLIIEGERNNTMATSTLGQMTKKEFTKILSNVVEQKLVELYGDPDEGLLSYSQTPFGNASV